MINAGHHFVLLPGLDGTGQLFQPFVEQFPSPDNVSVISYPMDRHIPHAQLIDYVIAELPQNKPLIILGESYSGSVALGVVAKGLLDVRGIILVATFAKYPDSLFKYLAGLMPLSLLFRLPAPDVLLRYFCFSTYAGKALNDGLRTSIKANDPSVLAQRTREGSKVDVTPLLSKIKVPCLMLSASNDKLVPQSATQAFKAHLEQLQCVTINGPHFILQTQPEACFQAMQQWLHGIARG